MRRAVRSPRLTIVSPGAVLSLIAVFTSAAARAEEAVHFPPEQIEFFENRVRPLLVAHCYECHSAQSKQVRGGLRLDSRQNVLTGGESGPVVVPGKPDESLVVEAVRFTSLEMPPQGKLADDEIAALEEWIAMGAPWPQAAPSPAVEQQEKTWDWKTLRGAHWAWQPIARPAPPPVGAVEWPKSPIDQFVLARLEAASLAPAHPADRATLVRRIYFDLIGLPPTPEEVQAFVEDARPEALAELVDRLLESPHYGEHWGRHWLDVARYSDGLGGFADSQPLPGAWRYRDWVIGALNRDLPYDQFLKQQIAGDLLNVPDGEVATGLFAIGPTYMSDGGDPDSEADAEAQTLDDRVDTLTRGMLGLTVSCARCHDHKYDPIPQQDYYSLAGIFKNTRQVDKPLGDDDRVHTLADDGDRDMHVAIRGNLLRPGNVAPRRFLRILAGENAPPFTVGSGRLELAEAVASSANPLTARVIANRVWLHFFGQGLVRTPSNFGALGEPPTHPQLLDWLASALIDSGWSLKQLHRTILLSATYQMSSEFRPEAFAVDGDNKLLWRMNVRRLTAESWRDALLAASGELDSTIGGRPTENVLDSRRRTLYTRISRNGDRSISDEFLRLFDFPLPRATSDQRTTSIVPQQFLFMLNSQFMIDRSEALAERVHGEAATEERRIERVYQILFGRAPSETENALGLAFVQEATAEKQATRWKQYAQVLLSANEFMYIK